MQKKPLVLVIDDEPDIRELLAITLSRMRIDSLCVGDLQAARALLAEQRFDLCLVDMKLPDGSGVDFIPYLQKNHPMLPVAVITAHGSIESAIQSLKSGAFDFLSKPIDLKVLRSLVKTALNISSAKVKPKSNLIGVSKVILKVHEIINKLSRSQAPVHISGESGTGKELAARIIHEQGPRANYPFVPVNCGAIPQELVESELFGYKKGSFTGAVNDKEGLFQAAKDGTLFFDEIAELTNHMQVKLLRAVQEKSVRPVGGTSEIPTNVRILSATHKHLDQLVGEGTFRQDLYYRINVIELSMPPLRQRPEDIAVLVPALLDKRFGQESRKIKIADGAMKKLAAYHFPGNIRELENILERSVTLCEGNIIHADDLQIPNSKSYDSNNETLDSYLDEIEKKKILGALEKTKWNKTAAAKLLGISFRALRYRLDKLGL